jgi:hypothetical protein
MNQMTAVEMRDPTDRYAITDGYSLERMISHCRQDRHARCQQARRRKVMRRSSTPDWQAEGASP